MRAAPTGRRPTELDCLSAGVGDGAETWAPMARAVVGGMTVSTFLTLFVIPILYVTLAGYRDKKSKAPHPGEGPVALEAA